MPAARSASPSSRRATPKASALGECARGVDEPVAVGVGLDGRDHARARREAAHDREVVAQRSGVDRRTRELHATPFSLRTAVAVRDFGREVLELRVLPEEGQLHSPIGPLRCLAMMMSAMPLRVVFLS